MNDYNIISGDGYSHMIGLHTKCNELGIRRRIVNASYGLELVFELTEEDVVALTLTFPMLKLEKYNKYNQQ